MSFTAGIVDRANIVVVTWRGVGGVRTALLGIAEIIGAGVHIVTGNGRRLAEPTRAVAGWVA